MNPLDTAKTLFKLAQQIDNIEITQHVINLQQDIMQMQESMGSLQKENEELKNLKAINEELELKENAYWRPSAPETRQGPFCIQCWSQYEILQPLVVSDIGHQTCPNPDCDGDFPTTESRRIQKERNARALAHAEAKRAQLRGRRSNRPIDPF